MQSLADMKHRNPLVIAGDLHATGVGTMHGAGNLDFGDNPITNILCGPVGTSIRGFPSAVRGVRSTPPQHLDFHWSLITQSSWNDLELAERRLLRSTTTRRHQHPTQLLSLKPKTVGALRFNHFISLPDIYGSKPTRLVSGCAPTTAFHTQDR